MKAVILAAGDPQIDTLPVSNLEVAGRTLLDVQVSCLRSCGVEDIVLIAGYRAEAVRRADIEIRINDRWRGTKSAASLRCAMDVFDGKEDVLIVYGDTLFEPPVIEAASVSPEPVAPVCYLDREERDLGAFREYALIRDGRIQEITGEPGPAGIRTVFTGVVLVAAGHAQIFARHLLQQQGHLGDLINDMCAMGVAIYPPVIEQGWAEITSLESYTLVLAQTDLLQRLTQLHADWSKRSERYNQLQWVNNDALLQRIVDIARVVEPQKVIDVGTGTGKVLFALKDALGDGDYWGIDYSQAMLDQVSRKDEVTLLRRDVERMSDVPTGYFELATARMIFHHLNEPVAAARNVFDLITPGGMFIICEGVPPTLRTIDWYTDMFRYKEDRNTLTEVDLINTLLRAGFQDMSTHSVVMQECSLNNWLNNAGIPQENVDIITEMHFNAPEYVKEDYAMRFDDGDCLMTWRFAVTTGIKPA